MRESVMSDEVVPIPMQKASKLAYHHLSKQLVTHDLGVLHNLFLEPKDLHGVMWANTRIIFEENIQIKPCANRWKPCMHMIRKTNQASCSNACRQRVKYWKVQENG